MINQLKIQILCDNTASGNYLGEHGLSFFIESDDMNILFDTGRGYTFTHNVKISEIDLQKTNFLILSHGHYDHTGGISDFFRISGIKQKISNNFKIIMHPKTLDEKYSKTPEGAKYIGISPDDKETLMKYSNNIETTKKLVTISSNIKLTGEIPLINKLESANNHFFINKELSAADKLPDDKALFFKTSKGIIVLLGCCHSGLGNTLDYISEVEKTDSIYAVIGGTHLRSAKKARLDFTIDILKKYNVSFFAPNHCTGQKSISYIYSQIPSIIHPAPAGTRFIF